MKKKYHGIKKKLFTSLRWHACASIIFECSKFLHQIGLIMLLGIEQYGQISIIFSTMYLTIHFFDFESGPCLLPHQKKLLGNRSLFRSFMLIYCSINLAILAFGALCAHYILFYYFASLSRWSTLVITSLIISEGLRTFFRFFLATSFHTKAPIIIDTLASIGYFLFFWFMVLFFKYKATLFLILLPYAFMSWSAVIGLGVLIVNMYLHAPVSDKKIAAFKLVHRVAITRCIYSLTHISNYFFTGNFLTPLFAAKFGVAYAGVLKCASYCADTIKALLKVSIGFSGGALLAQLKTKSMRIKKQIFSILWYLFNNSVYPLLIFIGINYHLFYHIWQKRSVLMGKSMSHIPLSNDALLISLILLTITLLEQVVIVYQEFYLIEQRTRDILVIKLFEALMFYVFVVFGFAKTASLLLMLTLALRAVTLFMISVHAYTVWGIKPTNRTDKRLIALSIGSAVVINYLYSIIV